MSARTRFDAAYYRRFYGNRATRVADAGSYRRLARFVAAYLRHLELPVESVLDLGCGLGNWRAALAEELPKASYTGVEVSDYLCERYGWTKASVVDFDPGRAFDLVICQGVLQYLPDRHAARAIGNLARLTRNALFLEVLTRRDWRENCDRETTDRDVHLRDGDWYRRRLRRHFVNCGGGVFVPRSSPAVLFELEALP